MLHRHKELHCSEKKVFSGAAAGFSSGFTLLELLIVMAIMAIISAVTLPQLGGMTETARLSTASRTAVMVGRYARTMSLLYQVEIDLIIAMKSGEMRVEVAPVVRELDISEDEGEEKDEEPEASAVDLYSDGLSSRLKMLSTNTAVHAASESLETIKETHTLDRVRVASVLYTGLEEHELTEGEARIRYHSNGTCVPYRLTLIAGTDREDIDSMRVCIEVDTLGSVTVTRREE